MTEPRPFLEAAPADAKATLLLAHGAGAGMDTRYMEEICQLLADRNVATLRFEFDYMAARRTGAKRKPPPKAEKLVDEYRAAVKAATKQIRNSRTGRHRLAIGGKSMGGRVASLVAGELHEKREVAALVCLGYPFHPPGIPEKTRTEHLAALACPTLIVQGERDPFGNRDDVAGYTFAPSIALHWIDDGDHDFGPRGSSGFTRKGNLAAAADAVATFLLQGR